jgi:hypothetical protein
MQAYCLTGVFLATALLIFSPMSQAESTPAKRQLVACKSEALWSEMHGYQETKDQKGVTKLMSSKQCVLIAASEAISIVRPGILTATIEYNGMTLYTRADTLR